MVRRMLSHVVSRSDIEQAVPSAFLLATMIDPCDRLLFDQVSSGSPEFRRGESEKAPLRK
jgi:hypothetical protein